MSVTAAKRAANVAAQRPTIPTQVIDANGVRIRTVAVHLTPFAPGVASCAIDHPRRWKTLYGVTPREAVIKTLARLALSPRDATARAEANGDVSLMAPVPPELLRLVSGARGEPAPFAVFWDGLTAAEVGAELEALRATGWEPDIAIARPQA